MAAASSDHYHREAERVAALLPEGPRVAVIGSTDFWHGDSDLTCVKIGHLLAEIPELTLLTGGVEGVGEAVGRSFFRNRWDSGQDPRVYHVLPEGEPVWDYGQTLFAGSDMVQRREILARLSRLYVMVEGGPGTIHEAKVASAQDAVVIPVGRSGGGAGELYDRMPRPLAIDADTWAMLGSKDATAEETALATIQAVRASLEFLA